VRKRNIYIDKYGPVAGSKLYHALQSQAAHAGVSARLRRKLRAITSGRPWPPARKTMEPLPLFPEVQTELDHDHDHETSAVAVAEREPIDDSEDA
jgi:hypothetical protein